MIDASKYDEYTQEEIDEAVEELDRKVARPKAELEAKLVELLDYQIALHEVVKSILKESPRTYNDVHNYDRFSEWDRESHPPKVSEDEWKLLSPADGSTELRRIATDLVPSSVHTVYCLECTIDARSVRSLERRSNQLFGETLFGNHHGFVLRRLAVGSSSRLASAVTSRSIKTSPTCVSTRRRP